MQTGNQIEKSIENSRPDVSVIIPIYNVDEYLKECLDSLMRQGDISLEVIMMDDGSTDSSGEIAKEYAEKYPDFHYHLLENGGPGRARNMGFTYARGKYVIYCDGDDIVPENTYYKMFRLAEETDSEIVTCNAERFNSQRSWNSRMHWKALSANERVTHIKHNYNLLYDTTSPTKMLRRDFYERNGFRYPEGIIYEDIPFSLQAYLSCNRVATMKEIGYRWRSRDGESKSFTQEVDTMRNLSDRLEILRNLRPLYDNESTGREFALAEQQKILDIDLKVFVNKFNTMPREQALDMIDRMNEFINEEIYPEAFDGLPVIDRQKYEYVRKRDLDSLIRLLDYDNYRNEPILEQDGRLMVRLPDDLFTIADRDVTDEFRNVIPKVAVDNISKSGETFTIDAHIYRRRINIKPGDQKVSVYLSDNINRIALPTEPLESPELTEKFGRVTNEVTGETSEYNYDGAGFRFIIDLNDLADKGFETGRYHIEIDYANRFFEGTEILKGARKSLREKRGKTLIQHDNLTATILFTESNELNILLNNRSVFVEGAAVSGEYLELTLNGNEDSVVACPYETDEAEDRVSVRAEQTANDTYRINCDSLSKNELYYIAAGDKESDILLGRKRKAGFLFGDNTGDGIAVMSSYKTNRILLRSLDSITYIKRFATVDSNVEFSTVRRSRERRAKKPKCARIVYVDKVSGERTSIAETKSCSVTAEGIQCNFILSFGDKETALDMCEGRQEVYIEYEFRWKKYVSEPIYCNKDYRYECERDACTIRFYRSMYATMRLQVDRKDLQSV